MPNGTRGLDGFTLVEVATALVLVVLLAAGAAELCAVAARASDRARLETTALALATARLEELRGLTWGYGDATAPAVVSDLSSNLAADPPDASGGGLTISPPGALDDDTVGYVDFLDRRGAWVGAGPSPPAATAFVRRWSIQPVATAADALALQVRVLARTGPFTDVRLATIKTRKAR